MRLDFMDKQQQQLILPFSYMPSRRRHFAISRGEVTQSRDEGMFVYWRLVASALSCTGFRLPVLLPLYHSLLQKNLLQQNLQTI